jgi:hypothetical protein
VTGGFLAAPGDLSSTSPRSLSPDSDISFARRVVELVEIIEDIGLSLGLNPGTPEEESYRIDGGPDLRIGLRAATRTVSQVHFLLRYGDDAGDVWDALSRAARRSSVNLPDSVVSFDTELDLDVEGSDDDEESPGAGGSWQTLRRLITLVNDGEGVRIDERMARSAIKVYALWNRLCHRTNLRNATSADIAHDAGDVGDLLPEGLNQDRATWERIVESSLHLGMWSADALPPG